MSLDVLIRIIGVALLVFGVGASGLITGLPFIIFAVGAGMVVGSL